VGNPLPGKVPVEKWYKKILIVSIANEKMQLNKE
jgi:hypothetical protein